MSFQIIISANRRAAARFVGNVRRALQRAYVEEQKRTGITQTKIAHALGVHRSVINRELKGTKDMTLGRVAELAWALGRKPVFELEPLPISTTANHLPQFSAAASAPSVIPRSVESTAASSDGRVSV